jgi:Flp pilus assembly protein TadD
MKVAMDLRAEKGAREAMAGYMVEGDVFAAQKQYMRAVEAYESARKYDADNRALLLRLNAAKQRAGDNNGGMEILSDWLRSHPDDMDIRAILAMAYQSNGKRDPAISQYEQILAKQPNHAIALNNLAWLYQERGDTRALKYAERVYDLVPDSPAIADTYGWTLVQQGSATKGLIVLQKAVSKAPHMLEIRYHLAVAMERTGKKLEARTELESLLKDGKKFPQADEAREMLRRLQRL